MFDFQHGGMILKKYLPILRNSPFFKGLTDQRRFPNAAASENAHHLGRFSSLYYVPKMLQCGDFFRSAVKTHNAVL